MRDVLQLKWLLELSTNCERVRQGTATGQRSLGERVWYVSLNMRPQPANRSQKRGKATISFGTHALLYYILA